MMSVGVCTELLGVPLGCLICGQLDPATGVLFPRLLRHVLGCFLPKRHIPDLYDQL